MQSLLSQLHKDSTEVEVQQCLTYLHDTYPNCTHQLYSNATVMYRDSSHRNNWRASPECSDLHHGAIFSEWLHMRLPPTTIRLGLFMSLQSTWVGAQNPQHQYPQHVWVAAIRPASVNIRGVLTDTPIKTICQSVDRLANGALLTVRLTELPIVHRLPLDQPVHQSIAASFNRTTNMQYANSQPVLELTGHNHRLNAHRYVGH